MNTTLRASLQPKFRTIDGLSIRFAESEDRSLGAHALLLSPWPESLFAFEATWPRLAEHAHLVAVDLPGFGHSEGRDALLSPRGASLFAAALHPGRLRSLVIGSAGAAFPLQLGPVLMEWIQTPDLEPYRRTGGRQIVAEAIGTLERYVLSGAAREDYLSSYEGTRFAESMAYVRAYPTDLPILGGLLPDIQTPALIIAGARDEVVPPVNAEYLHARLPKSRLAVVDTGHFTWEDAADEYAALVTAWWAGGYAATDRGSGG